MPFNSSSYRYGPFPQDDSQGRDTLRQWSKDFNPSFTTDAKGTFIRGFGQVFFRPGSPRQEPLPADTNQQAFYLLLNPTQPTGRSQPDPGPGPDPGTSSDISSTETSSQYNSSGLGTSSQTAGDTVVDPTSQTGSTSFAVPTGESSSYQDASSTSSRFTYTSGTGSCADPGPTSCNAALALVGAGGCMSGGVFLAPGICCWPMGDVGAPVDWDSNRNICAATYGVATLCGCHLFSCPTPPSSPPCDGTYEYGAADVGCCYSNGTAIYHFAAIPCTC